jgi:AraC-like DNA-binding protein
MSLSHMSSSSRVDVLTDMLQRSRAQGAAFCRTTAYGSWGLSLPRRAALSIHAILEGEVNLWAEDPGDAATLRPGDVMLVREHVAHHLAHASGAPTESFEALLEPGAGVSRQVTVGHPHAPHASHRASFFCGAYLFSGDLAHGLIEALPSTLRLHPAPGSTLRATLDMLGREMLVDEPGQQTLLDRLLDVALVQIVREHFRTSGALAPGWFQASVDARIGPALRALHERPGHPWTVAELAGEAALSRSAFARRFAEVLGMAPLAYLGDWRMALARDRLRHSDARLAEIAAALGYASEFSFAAAFKRHHGIAPGRWRAESREPPAAADGSPAPVADRRRL